MQMQAGIRNPNPKYLIYGFRLFPSFAFPKLKKITDLSNTDFIFTFRSELNGIKLFALTASIK